MNDKRLDLADQARSRSMSSKRSAAVRCLPRWRRRPAPLLDACPQAAAVDYSSQ